jgi:hypothetical protein
MRELFSGMQDLTQEERQAKMAELGKKMQAQGEETKKAVEGILLPDQLKRLKGIALQRMGAMALSDKDVQKELKFSDDQVAKIKSVGEDMMKKGRELFQSAGNFRDMTDEERADFRKKGEDLRKESETKVMDVLTADQKAQLEQLKGKKLDIPDSEMRGGMGGGRRGNRGGGGGGGPIN